MEEKISKTKQKEMAHKMQKLGAKFVKLDLNKLNALSLSEPLMAAILEAKRLKDFSAINRQEQYIGKLMRNLDYNLLETEYLKLVK